MSTKIEWTEVTWNPVRGCSRVSPGCEHCYAERQARRHDHPGGAYYGLTVMGQHGPKWNGKVRVVPHKLEEPLRWRKPRRIFVNSMSDLFHEDIPDEYIAAVFGVMAACPQHTFQVLTKRADRMLAWFRWLDADRPDSNGNPVSWYPFGTALSEHSNFGINEPLRQAIASHPRHSNRQRDLRWPLPNVWLGVSAEDQQRADERIPVLMQCPAEVRFVSLEPLLGPVKLTKLPHPDHGMGLSLDGLHWVIVGGESGPGARECQIAWVRDILAQCERNGIACFVKQLGAQPTGAGAHPGMVDRKGGDPSEWPEDLRVRTYP